MRSNPSSNCNPNENQDEILRELNENETKELMDLYEKKYGKNDFHYLLMYNQCKWDKILKDRENCDDDDGEKWISFRKRFFTHRNGDFRKYGTYISLHYDIMQSISFYSWESDHKELLECLEQSNLIDWSNGPLLTNVYMELCEAVKQIAKAKNIRIQRARQCHGVILSHAKALSFAIPTLPEGYKFSRLLPEHADSIHSLWTNKKEGSLEYVRRLIEINQTLGIFAEVNNKLVSWIFQNDFSGLGILEVLPEVQRQGLGTALAIALCKQIAESEQVQVSAWFVDENFKSEALLEKIGFEKSIMAEWIQLQRSSEDK